MCTITATARASASTAHASSRTASPLPDPRGTFAAVAVGQRRCELSRGPLRDGRGLLGLSNFLEIRALESTEGENWRPLRGTADGLLVRADTGTVFTPHVSWRDGKTMVLLFTRAHRSPTWKRTRSCTGGPSPCRQRAMTRSARRTWGRLVGAGRRAGRPRARRRAGGTARGLTRKRTFSTRMHPWRDRPASMTTRGEVGCPCRGFSIHSRRSNAMSPSGSGPSSQARGDWWPATTRSLKRGRDDSVQAIIVAPEEHVHREPRGTGAGAAREGDSAPGGVPFDRVAVGVPPLDSLSTRWTGSTPGSRRVLAQRRKLDRRPVTATD